MFVATNPLAAGVPRLGYVKGETLLRRTVCKLERCSLQKKPKVSFAEIEGRPTFMEKVPTPVPDRSTSMQLRIQICYLIGLNNTVLIGWNHAF